MSDEDDWRTFPHGTITNVLCNRGTRGNMTTALYHIYWVDQQCRNAPQAKVRIYTDKDVKDELEAYAKFRKEMEEQEQTNNVRATR